MKAIVTVALAAIFLAGACGSWAAAPPPKKAKPSSYAPRPVPPNRVYGTPIQPPITAHAKAAHHHAHKKHSAKKTAKHSTKKKVPQ